MKEVSKSYTFDVSAKKKVKTRNLEKTRGEILMAAFGLVFRRGFQGVSVDEIVAETSLSKGAFYHQFPTKLDLGYALVQEVIQPMIITRWIEPLKTFDDPLAGILTQLRRLIGEASPDELKLGCPLNNLVQEMAPVDREFKRHLKAALNLWIDEMDQQLRRAKAGGYLKKSVDTHALAEFIVMAHEGFYGMLKGLDDPSSFRALYKSLADYFKTLR